MCEQCEALMIQNVLCHETGCPDIWKDEMRDCRECGMKFKPQKKYQMFCDQECLVMYLDIS